MPTRTIVVKNESERTEAIAAVQQERPPFKVVISPPRKKYRRTQQNLLFAVMRYIALEVGNVGNVQIKLFEEDILRHHLGVLTIDVKKANGGRVKRTLRRSSTELDKDGMTKLIEKIIADAANAGIIVPTKDEIFEIADTNPFYDKDYANGKEGPEEGD